MATISTRLYGSIATGVVAAGLISAPAVAAETSAPVTGAVVNPSFEASAGGRPECWTAGGARSTVSSTTEARTGSVAMHVRGRGTDTDHVELGTTRTAACGIPVLPEHSYTVGAWYRASAMVTPVVYTYSRADGWRSWFTAAPYTGSTPWQKIETLTPPVPAGVEMIGLGFGVPGTAKLVLDDAEVVDATTTLDSDVLGRRPTFTPSFGDSTALVTNEYAYYNSTHADAVRSSVWETTSGSLFAKDGGGYTGKLDAARPDARSVKATDSAIFRLRTRASSFGNVKVNVRLTVAEMGSTRRTPATRYDGVHLWLRYDSPFHLYAVSVARRDGGVVIKKKCPGGPSNDGTYYTLGKQVFGYPVTQGRSTQVGATVRNNPSGTVTLTLSVGGRTVMTATDTGEGCAPLTAPGAVGIRGDNTRFSFHEFTVAANSR